MLRRRKYRSLAVVYKTMPPVPVAVTSGNDLQLRPACENCRQSLDRVCPRLQVEQYFSHQSKANRCYWRAPTSNERNSRTEASTTAKNDTYEGDDGATANESKGREDRSRRSRRREGGEGREKRRGECYVCKVCMCSEL